MRVKPKEPITNQNYDLFLNHMAYIFHSIHDIKKYPSSLSLDFEPCLFNTSLHLTSQDEHNWVSFLWEDTTLKKIVALVHFHLENSLARSPFRATFGGIECSTSLNNLQIQLFIEKCATHLWQQKIGVIQLVLPPDSYQPANASNIKAALLATGFSIAYEEHNQQILIENREFADIVHRSKKRKLNKCKKALMRVELLAPSHLPNFYELLRKARQRKGYALTLDLTTLQMLFERFSKHFFLFGVLTTDNQLVAASVAVRTRTDILYYFLPADDANYLTHSPMVLLIEEMYNYCQSHAIGLLDLGTSSFKGKYPWGEGLSTFKKQCGATACSKSIFELIKS
jgi:Acetyltransferase (GNAT) domain